MQKPNLNPPIKSVCTSTNAATASNPVFVIETYKSGTQWYRKYSDGVIEQGGWSDNFAENTVRTNNFVTPYTDATSVSIHLTFISTSTYSNIRGCLEVASNTATTFSVHCDTFTNNSNGYYWYARGV